MFRHFAILAVLFSMVTVSRADTRDLLLRVPADANMLVFIDVQKALASPLAVKEGWADKKRADPPVFLLPGASTILIASELNLRAMDPAWTVSLLDLPKPPSMSSIAISESGYTDQIGGKNAVCSARDAFYIQLDSKVLGVVAPANRQFATRWAGGKNANALSPYLRTVADSLNAGGTVIMALDLENAVSAIGARRTIAADPGIQSLVRSLNQDSLATAIAGIKGLTLRIDIAQDISARATLDFAGSAAVFAPVVHPLLLEVLDGKGLHLDDLKSWKTTVQGTKIISEGKLTTDSLRMLLSLVEPPSPQESSDAAISAAPATPGAPAASAPVGDPKVEASRKYFKAISGMLDRYGNAPTLGDMANWLKSDAQRIERLSLVNVDPDLAQWGAEVSSNLSLAAAAAQQGQMMVSARAASIPLPTTVATDPAQAAQARRETENALNQRRQAALEAKAQASGEASKYITAATTSRSKIRADMVAKYNADF